MQIILIGAKPTYSSYYSGYSVGAIHISEVECTGDEEYLINCTFTQDHFCWNDRRAGVTCLEGECTEGEVRLVGGVNETDGRVEVCLFGYWGKVCENSWTYQDAQVVCKQLGYPYTGELLQQYLNIYNAYTLFLLAVALCITSYYKLCLKNDVISSKQKHSLTHTMEATQIS